MDKRAFLFYLKSYKIWLERLGYAQATCYSYVQSVGYFMNWLGSEGRLLTQLEPRGMNDYTNWLEQRGNQRRGGGLDIKTIYGYLDALYNFSEYLFNYEGIRLPELDTAHLPKAIKDQHFEVLTKQEILKLYNATDNSMLGVRDRAILSLYYGCGLRRQEGVNLLREDIDFRRSYLHVKKGKGSRDRIIPMSNAVRSDLQAFADYNPESKRYLSICGQTVLSRVKKLSENAGINKVVTVHSLRHSIATHLLDQGMSLGEIRQFLGHSSLDTTQIYTHILASYE